MEDYVKIYEECLNRSYHNEKLETIISCLYDIVNHYDKAIKEDSNASTMEDYKKHYSNIRRSIMEDLLIIFNIIIEKNNYKDLNEVIAFAFELNIDWAFINDYLNVIYNLENFDKENNFDCDMVMVEIRSKIGCNEMNDNYSFPFYKMLSCYKRYDIMVNNSNIKSEIKRFFNRYSLAILYYFYLKNYDVQELEKIYVNIINNFDYYISIFEMNYNDMNIPYVLIQNEEKRIIKKIAEEHLNNKKLIK